MMMMRIPRRGKSTRPHVTAVGSNTRYAANRCNRNCVTVVDVSFCTVRRSSGYRYLIRATYDSSNEVLSIISTFTVRKLTSDGIATSEMRYHHQQLLRRKAYYPSRCRAIIAELPLPTREGEFCFENGREGIRMTWCSNWKPNN